MLSCSQHRALAQASYTFMTGVSCSSELCGRMVLLFECSFSRFCKKPVLLRPSRMTVLLEPRLTWVLRGKKRGTRLICIYKYAVWTKWRVHTHRLSTHIPGCTASSMSEKKSFLPLWLEHEDLSAAEQLHIIIKMTPFCPNTGCYNWPQGVCSALVYLKEKNMNWE